MLLRSVDPKYNEKENTVLKHLNMTRKNIKDESGVIIAESLCRTRYLECIELAGNLLEANAAAAMGKMLVRNKWLKKLELECNNLTCNGKDNRGIKAIAEGLRNNRTLISLNLSHCNLNEECSKILA